MKVLIINQHISDALGGSEMQCDLIARGLTNLGHQIIYGATGKKKKEKYFNFPYKINPLAIEKKNKLSKFLKKEKPDIVYWRFDKRYLLKSVKQIKKEKIPIIFAISSVENITKYPHIYQLNKKGLINKFKNITKVTIIKIRSRWNYRAFKYINAVTTLNSQYKNKLKVKKQKLIWNSVSREKDSFEWKKPYITWVANIKTQKQPEKYIELALFLSKKYPHIDFLMIGAIQDKKYKIIIKNANKNKNFHYLGFQTPEKVNGILAKSICLIHTCKPEGFGNNFIQSWMQSCPTISLEFDPDNLIKNKKIGFLSGSFEQMIEDTEELIKNKELRDSMGNKAKKFAINNFNPDRMTEQIEQFLIKISKEYKNK